MEILPAIDLRGGKVVRLTRGDYDAETVYSDKPAEVARQFVAAGAKWIHVVDLEAAKTGRAVNTDSIRSIRQAVDVNIELGGGARDQAAIEAMLDLGADRVVVGSAALKDWAWFERMLAAEGLAGRLALGLDGRDGKLYMYGWTESSDVAAIELARRVSGSGLGAIVYTDIARDGMLTGVNVEKTEELVSATDISIIASGGVCSLQDIQQCRRIGCGGAIIGKAYYEGKIDLSQAIAEAVG